MAAGVSGSFVPKSLPVEARNSTLIIGHGKTHHSLMSGDRRNAPARVNEMLAERALMLCFFALQKPYSAPWLPELRLHNTATTVIWRDAALNLR